MVTSATQLVFLCSSDSTVVVAVLRTQHATLLPHATAMSDLFRHVFKYRQYCLMFAPADTNAHSRTTYCTKDYYIMLTIH